MQRRLKVCELDGLAEESIHASGIARLSRLVQHIGRDRDDGGAVATLAQGPCRLKPVHHRHLAVHQDKLKGPLLQNLDGLRSIAGDLALDAEPLQHGRHHSLVDEVVLDQQDVTGEPNDRETRGPLSFCCQDRVSQFPTGDRGCDHALHHVASVLADPGPLRDDDPAVGDRRQGGEDSAEARAAIQDHHRGSRRLLRRHHLRCPERHEVAPRDVATPSQVPTEDELDSGEVGERGLEPGSLQVELCSELRTLARTALHLDGPAHEPDELPADRQPQPGAAKAPRG